MVRSRRFRKNQEKPEWGKNNPQNKERNRKALIAVGIIVVAAVAISVFFVFGYGSLFPSPAVSPSPSPTASVSPSASISPTANPSATPQPVATPATLPVGEYSVNGTRILLQTSMGNITIQLRDDKPITAANFINLTQLGLYDGTTFHRVIKDFMIQGGVVQQNLPKIPDEIGNDNQNIIGTIAMAKTSEANSATSSFFINVANNGQNAVDQAGTKFDSVYTVFGKVIGGMDVVNAIANVPVGPNPQMGGENSGPLQTITLIKATILP
jgi:cyclophilin family peptidyl-prolyl cis-trans isomerase